MNTINKSFSDKVSRHGLIEMILTSIVNNETILNTVIDDVEERFKVKLDKNRVEAFLNTVDVSVDNSINFL